VESITREEDVRTLKCQIFLLQDEFDALNEQLANEEENVDDLEQRLVDAECRADELNDEAQRLSNDLKIKARELENTKV
jgi:Skp family chaperone for outer membrane proteins